MAETLKVLGQHNTAANTQATLYAVPAATSAVISSIVVANQNTTKATFRLRVCIANAADDKKQFLAKDVSLLANGMATLTLGITLAATDTIKVHSDSADVSFNAFGTEVI